VKIDYESLNDDHEVAFAQIVEQLDAQIEPILAEATQESDERPAMLDYMNTAIACARELGIEEISGWSLPAYNDVYGDFNKFKFDTKTFAIRIRLRRQMVGTIYSVALPVTTKKKIHHFIARIRETISGSDLTERKRNSLFSKLNAFAADVDRTRTRFENAMLALSDLADVAKKGTDALKPITELVNSITALIGEAKSVEPEPAKLPAPSERKKIEAPRRRIEGPKFSQELEDEIPF
jgi:hypothetical protein